MNLLFGIALLITAQVGGSCEFISVYPPDRPMVDDAFERFAPGRPDVREGYFAVVVTVGEHRCVNLRPRLGTLGPLPTYCYDRNGAFVAVYGLAQ